MELRTTILCILWLAITHAAVHGQDQITIATLCEQPATAFSPTLDEFSFRHASPNGIMFFRHGGFGDVPDLAASTQRRDLFSGAWRPKGKRFLESWIFVRAGQ